LYDEKCDIWSIGVMLYLLLTKTLPFESLSDDRDNLYLKKKVLLGKYNEMRKKIVFNIYSSVKLFRGMSLNDQGHALDRPEEEAKRRKTAERLHMVEAPSIEKL
jgi:serine/threonine protein kinase